MSEKTTYTCDYCDNATIAKMLPSSWDYINVSASRSGYHVTMHLCETCLKSLDAPTGAKLIIRRLIDLVTRRSNYPTV